MAYAELGANSLEQEDIILNPQHKLQVRILIGTKGVSALGVKVNLIMLGHSHLTTSPNLGIDTSLEAKYSWQGN